MVDQQLADCSFELAGRIVHVWVVRTFASNKVAWELEQVLAPVEKDRAARFRFNNLRHSFILARGALRILLGLLEHISGQHSI